MMLDRGAARWNPLASGARRALQSVKDGSVVRVVADLFAPGVGHARVSRAWNAMWARPEVTFLVETRRVRPLFRWTLDHASRRSFGWGDNLPPMRCGELVDLDTLFYRNRCGWKDSDTDINNGYGCAHPRAKKSDEPGACFAWTCPIAYKNLACEQCGEGEDDCACADGYHYDEGNPDMELHERPRDAMAANVWVGTSIRPGDRDAADRVHMLAMARAWRRFVRLVGGAPMPPGHATRDGDEHDVHWTVRRGVWAETPPKRRLPLAKARVA